MFNKTLQPYTDGDGLVSNTLVPPGTVRASDNGVLFTSEALILANIQGESLPVSYVTALNSCIDSSEHLHRAPNDLSADTPDDTIGILSLICSGQEGITPIALTLSVCQPVIMYAWLASRNIRAYHLFSLVAACIIALSNINEPSSSTSNKMLTWVLIKGLSKKSLLCKLAGKIWTYRMTKIYGSTKAIAETYFGPSHPFVANWAE
jgi:hypothetical protein